VPGAAVGVGVGIEHLRKSVVRAAPFLRKGRLVDGRPHKRMVEPHAGADLEQARFRCWSRRLEPDPELFGCPEHQPRIAQRIERGDQQQLSGRHGEWREPLPVALLDPAR
jgi:hypothetical protein